MSISKTRITKQTSLTTDINLKNYAIEFTPTESSAGARLLHIASYLSNKPWPEIISPKKRNIVISCLYKHPNMDVLDLNKIFEIVSKE